MFNVFYYMNEKRQRKVNTKCKTKHINTEKSKIYTKTHIYIHLTLYDIQYIKATFFKKNKSCPYRLRLIYLSRIG